MVVSFRRFGTIYRSHFKEQAESLILEDGTCRCPEHSKEPLLQGASNHIRAQEFQIIYGLFFMDMSQIEFGRRMAVYVTH
jgi:hypothetical protein